MEDEAFFAQTPRERNYGRWLLGQLSPHWYFSHGLAGVQRWAKPLLAVALAVVYPAWFAIILVAITGYWLLWLLFAPVRVWAKKNKQGYYADEPPSS